MNVDGLKNREYYDLKSKDMNDQNNNQKMDAEEKMLRSGHDEKVIIIGGGPSGLAAAMYNARAFLNPLVIEGAPSGGQLMLTSEVENYPGIMSILGSELVANMRKHAEHFGTRFVTDNVKSVDFSDSDNLSVTLSGGKRITATSILIATGASALWLGLESEKRLMGKGVTACAICDGFFFKNKVVAVVGGGDTAMEEALALTIFASKVYIIHRRNEFRASPIMQKRVFEHEKIEVLWGTSVTEVLGDQRVEGVRLNFENDSSKEKISGDTLAVDGLFMAIGHKPNTGFLEGSGIDFNDKGYIVTSRMFAWERFKNPQWHPEYEAKNYDFTWQHTTNVKGVFAAGDVVDYVSRQGSTAAGLGVEASLEVERYLVER